MLVTVCLLASHGFMAGPRVGLQSVTTAHTSPLGLQSITDGLAIPELEPALVAAPLIGSATGLRLACMIPQPARSMLVAIAIPLVTLFVIGVLKGAPLRRPLHALANFDAKLRELRYGWLQEMRAFVSEPLTEQTAPTDGRPLLSVSDTRLFIEQQKRYGLSSSFRAKAAEQPVRLSWTRSSDSAQATVDSTQLTVDSAQVTVESAQTTVESAQATEEYGTEEYGI